MINCTRKLEFDAGHRVMGHEGKCAHLHGHRYVVEITAYAPQQDAIGRAVDFSVIKEVVGGWIDQNLDHGTLVNGLDSPLLEWLEAHGQKRWVMYGNPTAENIAELIQSKSLALLKPHGINAVAVTVYETPNSWSTFP